MRKLILLLLLFSSTLFALASDINITKEQQALLEEEVRVAQELKIKLDKERKERERQEKIDALIAQINELESEVLREKVWMKSYASYLTASEVRDSLTEIRNRIAYLAKRAKSTSEKDELNSLISKESILATQVNELKGKDTALFSQLLTPPAIDEVPKISNTFAIFTGLSFVKTFDTYLSDYLQRKENLTELIKLLRKENALYQKVLLLDTENRYKEVAKEKLTQLERFETALDTIMVTAEVYQKRLEVLEVKINREIEEQIYQLIRLGIVILVVLLVFFLLRLMVRKYITDNDRFYMANKILTFTNVSIIILILFFNYIENVNYLVTILGFASAGIAIAMKDWFMSMLGWLVIVFGGSIHVGDRIRVDMEGMKYVGDVMDISLLRMTVLEDVTLTSIEQNRRAGRIIFIPNNYIFTKMIANYTHSSLKTVWDGIKITITFDSNHKKAMHLAKEITKKFSKGYTDITRKQLNKLRNQYNLKNTNVEPRIFSFIEENGIDIEAWYLTNAYATLTLRSAISTEIIDAFNKEDDITIAYPTQRLHLQREKREERKEELA